MRFDDDLDDIKSGGSILYTALGVSAFILLVLGIVFLVNKKDSNSSSNYQAYVAKATQAVNPTEEETAELVENSKLTADDLDIWDMYPETDSGDDTELATDGENVSPSPEPVPSISPVVDDEKYNDGKHFKIEYADGSSEWLAIDNKRTLNTYDFTNLTSSDHKKKYYSDGKLISFTGIDVSRYQKDIDFAQVKNSGIDFVMIRLGARGYQSGQITIDEYFEKNIKAAQQAGLDVGVYFYSQAITPQEAIDEANIVKMALTDYKIKYPVAFDMEPVPNDSARIDTLNRDERSVIAASFINTIAAAGYKTLIYGNEEWLVKKIDLTKMPTISVWLSDESDMPDYPYQYSMWQYTTHGSVYGINGDVNMNICFIDYSAQ